MNSTNILAQLGEFQIVNERRIDKIQEFWAINYAVMVLEKGIANKKIWPVKRHSESIYILAYEGDVLVGGLRLIKPHDGRLLTHELLSPSNSLPDDGALRQLGAVGEATSLVALPRVRGRFDLTSFESIMRDVAHRYGMTHLIVNAVIPWRANALYALLGYRAYATPQFELGLKRHEEDRVPNVIPMIRSIRDGAPMPEDRWNYSLADMERISVQYLQGDDGCKAKVNSE